ncbi:MAG: zinc ribbon domain-containing protein, partial [SAR324 cluster bacterium]|nr:zinc ribbon domain-containing protein [SAR324 cluster bacterium]
MECRQCQHENPTGSRFCERCGKPLERSCPQCGRDVSADARFCNGCGHDLSAPVAPPERPPAPPTAPPAVREGERRQATVLFSDLSGYTAMNERLDPEEVEGLMRRLKDRAVEIVEGHGGIVSQFVGDEVLALFGIPIAHEDDPVRAVRAALALHEMARELSPEVELSLDRKLRLHSGINTGLIVTSLRDDRDGRVGVTGDTINVGARLKALADDDTILLGPETQKLVEDKFETDLLEPLALKGKAERVTAYRLLSERATPAKAHQPFIGRRAELRQFTGIIEECLESGRGQAVYVRGDAGIGKTSLVDEFQNLASARGFACHTGIVLDFGIAKGHDAIRTIVTSLLNIPPGASEDERREAGERAGADGFVEEAQAPFLNDLLDISQPRELHPIYDAMDNETRNRGKRETVCGLIRH